ncbi:sulfate ABC transporter substrate-binding protein [Methylomonas fluvii]|uniref:Sulfate ABC transporter substrate-binding protein n=1 Tax=Methylomonas fluvii TaxID=1854564 RepID=A0ABR9DKE5_9GAMM|nr:sulfate ABC transporter substrate-binding protein [Methylomonas fluvii]MBD9363583.1 sulfate ABC transporter substrate-binding protein [Methylomonas fluvii]
MRFTHTFKPLLFGIALALSGNALAERTLLNVSYDPTRELYKEYNQLFTQYWKTKTGEDVTVQQSHGGGGKQTRAVIDGLEADVVTLALSGDIDQIHDKANLLPKDWQSKLPNSSLPYTSTIVFLVRKGNPKAIKNWDDLIKDGVSVVTPNPKTSGGARYNYLAAWAFAEKKNGSKDAAKAFVEKLFKNVPVLDSGARGSTTTFAEREIGDVLITWENEAYLVLKEFGADKFEVVTPPFSILAEPPVAVIEAVAKKNGTQDLATEYLKYLYTKEAQEIIAKNFYRPTDKDIAAKYAKQFPSLELVSVAQLGGWSAIQKQHFDDNGVFDKIYGR